MPNLYIISGCNGAGKTTASYTILPEILNCKEFVNADEIAKGLSPFQPEKVSLEAGRIMLERIDDLLGIKADFSFETTLSTRSYVNTVKRAKENGYDVTLLYFWLNSQELAIERVKERVREGGHNIPEQVIRRRYNKGIKNLINLFIPVVDNWMVIDNSENPFLTVAEGQQGENMIIHDKNIWNRIIEISNEQ